MNYSTINQTMATAINVSSTLPSFGTNSTSTGTIQANETSNVTAVSWNNATSHSTYIQINSSVTEMVPANYTYETSTFTPVINQTSKSSTVSVTIFNATKMTTANETLNTTTVEPEHDTSTGSVRPSNQTLVSFNLTTITISSATFSNETNPNRTTTKNQSSTTTSGVTTGNNNC